MCGDAAYSSKRFSSNLKQRCNPSQTFNLKDSQVKPVEFAPKTSVLWASGKGILEVIHRV